VFLVSIHSRSEQARRVNPRKVYVIDTGLLQALSLSLTEDEARSSRTWCTCTCAVADSSPITT
jgi:predicted AAA+ superfamily ATPase